VLAAHAAAAAAAANTTCAVKMTTTTTMLASWLYARPPDRPPSMVAATPRRRNYRNPRDIINAPFGTRGKYPLGSLRRRRYGITPAAAAARYTHKLANGAPTCHRC